MLPASTKASSKFTTVNTVSIAIIWTSQSDFPNVHYSGRTYLKAAKQTHLQLIIKSIFNHSNCKQGSDSFQLA